MSDQVYGNSLPPPVNKIISELITAPGGDVVVNSLTITADPGTAVGLQQALTRDMVTGLVEYLDDLSVNDIQMQGTLKLVDDPEFSMVPERPLVRHTGAGPTQGDVEDAGIILVNGLVLSDIPQTSTTAPMCLVRNPAVFPAPNVGRVEQRLLPTAGTTARVKDTSQVVASGVDTVVLFPVEVLGDAGLTYDAGTGVFTVDTGGQFTVAWTAAWALDLTASGVRSTWLASNGNTVRYGQQMQSASGVPFPIGQSSCVSFSAPPGVTFEIHAFQTTVPAANLDLLGTTAGPPNITNVDITRVSI